MTLPNIFSKPFILSSSAVSLGNEFCSLITSHKKVLTCVSLKFAAENSMGYFLLFTLSSDFQFPSAYHSYLHVCLWYLLAVSLKSSPLNLFSNGNHFRTLIILLSSLHLL